MDQSEDWLRSPTAHFLSVTLAHQAEYSNASNVQLMQIPCRVVLSHWSALMSVRLGFSSGMVLSGSLNGILVAAPGVFLGQ